MAVHIDKCCITLFGNGLRYDPYYVSLAAEQACVDSATILMGLIRQWADTLMSDGSEGRTVYLPYSLDDEWVECLEAAIDGEQVVAKCVYVGFNGYSLDLLDISYFISGIWPIEEEASENFGVYLKSELIMALRNATVDLT